MAFSLLTKERVTDALAGAFMSGLESVLSPEDRAPWPEAEAAVTGTHRLPAFQSGFSHLLTALVLPCFPPASLVSALFLPRDVVVQLR